MEHLILNFHHLLANPHLLTTGGLDILLIILGFILGTASRWKTPITVVILLVRMARWYLQTHPTGQMIAKHTDIDEKLGHLFTDSEIKGEG